jgi:hypothetical protein
MIGTPAELMTRQERLRLVPVFDGDCVAASAAANGAWLCLLSSSGVLHGIDLGTLECAATFAGSRPLTGLAEGVPPRPELAAVEATDRVLLVHCERGGR